MLKLWLHKFLVVAKYDKNLDGIIEDKVNGRIFYKDEDLDGILFEVLMNKEELRRNGEKCL